MCNFSTMLLAAWLDGSMFPVWHVLPQREVCAFILHKLDTKAVQTPNLFFYIENKECVCACFSVYCISLCICVCVCAWEREKKRECWSDGLTVELQSDFFSFPFIPLFFFLFSCLLSSFLSVLSSVSFSFFRPFHMSLTWPSESVPQLRMNYIFT